MKEATVTWEGKKITFKYEVLLRIDLVYANVFDKYGKGHTFLLNNKGRFIRSWSCRNWPDGFCDLLNEILKKETPVPVYAVDFWGKPPETK